MRALLLLFLAAAAGFGAERYAVLLQGPPAAEQVKGKPAARRAALDTAAAIRAAQSTLSARLEQRGVVVTGATQLLLNAVFVRATAEQARDIAALAGVAGVVRTRRFRPLLNRALQLVQAPDAWAALGGQGQAGLGVKIGILDTGIDQTHPAMQDSSLPVPAGYPKCNGSDCAWTSNKVIVARSYVDRLAGSAQEPEDTRPDDLSPRDRVGHGTAVASAAAGNNAAGPLATISGVAPKAYVGNYKVFGSPGVNDYASSEGILRALEDAINDGMDIAVLSLGGPALTEPLSTGDICGLSPGLPCDLEATAVENAINLGMTVVTAAGNEGDIGEEFPTLSTVSSPATAPSAIAVAATTNGHIFTTAVRISGTSVPASLQRIPSVFGNGPRPAQPISAPLRDVRSAGGDALGCQQLPAGSLEGVIALVLRGDCTFAEKAGYVSDAGAAGMILYLASDSDELFTPGGLEQVRIPVVLISHSEGIQLTKLFAASTNLLATIDPALTEVPTQTFNRLVDFSSRGPSIGLNDLKPDLAATGTTMYMATQNFDPDGAMYDPSRYTVASGTSFSAPLVAGAVALVKQRHPEFTPLQLKSAVVNTANADITVDTGETDVLAVGAGLLQTGAAVNTTLTVTPSTISFGDLRNTSLPAARQLTLRNAGPGPQDIRLSIAPRSTAAQSQLALSETSFTLGAGQSRTVSLTLSGSRPTAGAYSGNVNIQGSGTAIHAPYIYMVGDSTPYDIIGLFGLGFEAPVGQPVPGGIGLKVTDRYGLPVSGVPVTFQVSRGGGRIQAADSRTDSFGVALAQPVLGASPGVYEYTARAGGLTTTFDGLGRRPATISAGGAVNAASFTAGQGIAPGSYLTLYGSALSDVSEASDRTVLPLSLEGVSVSFDVPSANLSLPGRVFYVSPGQVNVQVPWELEGQASAVIKVSIGDVSGQLYQLPLARYSPGIFEYAASGRRLAAALDGSFNLITAANPARRGTLVQLYVNGLGPVTNRPATGEPAPANPLAQSSTTPVVTIGGRPAAVQFSGLAPGFAALYQINVFVPADVSPGLAMVTVSVGGVESNTSTIPIG